MRKLGISVYPGHSQVSDILAYLDIAAKYGFKRVFTCLLSVEGDREQILSDFSSVVERAVSHGMAVIADVNPQVFEALGVSYQNLRFFKEIGLTGIRLDEGFDGNVEALMTLNPEGLLIELNTSMGTKYLDNIISYHPKMANLIGCHNFYPHRYTGLSVDHFLATSQQYKAYGLRTAAFVNSKVATLGPWPVSEGLCTLELHRDWPITAAAKWLWATDLIDDVIVANSFASEAELKALSELDPYLLSLDVVLEDKLREVDKSLILSELHQNRGDVSDYLIRSSMTRIKYADQPFPAFNTRDIQPGDILIDNDGYSRYAGELQIARLPMENSGRTNVVGHIAPHDLPLLDFLAPWQRFRLKEVE